MMQNLADDPRLLLHAALDGELDAAGMIEVERRTAADPVLAAEYARLVALRDAIRTRLPREMASPELRARIAALATADQKPAFKFRKPFQILQYRALAASLVIGIVLGAGGLGLLTRSAPDEVERAILAGYIHGRISGQTVDVATSDRHTVKPWLAAHVPVATMIADLAKDGFPLVGGRIDIVGTNPVATLVYQRREHFINVSELPGTGILETRSQLDGFTTLKWSDGIRTYFAVSDLPPAELDAFAAAFKLAVTEDLKSH